MYRLLRLRKTPKLNITKGVATVSYALDLNGRKDESLITWYRCTDRKGTNRLPVSVSRLNEPEYSYTLVKEDVGYYLMARYRSQALCVVCRGKNDCCFQLSDKKRASEHHSYI